MSLFMSVKEITSCKFLGPQVKSHDFAFDIMSCQLLSLTDGFKDLISTTLWDTFTFTTISNTFHSELLINSLFISSDNISDKNKNKTRE